MTLWLLNAPRPLVDAHLGYFTVCFGKIFLLGFLQELSSSSYGQDDAVCHPVVMETEVHSSIKVSSQQGLCDEPVHVWQENDKFHCYRK